MAENVNITRAIIIPFSKDTTEVLKEFKTESGAKIFSFRIQSKVNDRVPNSPNLYRKCSYYCKTEEESLKVKQLITNGSTIEINGVTDRKNYIDKKTNNKIYYDEINVKGILSINPSNVPENNSTNENVDEDLPF